MKPNYGKLAAIAILTLMLTTSTITILPQLFTTEAAFAYPPGTWRLKLQDLGNNTVPAGSVTVYLWNITSWGGAYLPYPAATYLRSFATVGANGIVTFPGLPGDTLNKTGIKYAISANYTLADGTVTDILVLPLLQIYTGNDSSVNDFKVGLAALLNDTTTPTVNFHHFTWLDGSKTRPGFIVFLAPVAFRAIDEAGFPLPGAGVEVWAEVFTNITGTSGTKIALYRLASAVANSTALFGNEFTNPTQGIGNMPGAIPLQLTDDFHADVPGNWNGSHNVGWVNLLLPALFWTDDVTTHGFSWVTPNAGTGAWTGLQNVTLLIRYKTNDPTVGPIVGRYSITAINFEHHVSWVPPNGPVKGTDKDPPYDDVHLGSLLAFIGDEHGGIDSGEMYPYVWCNVRWLYWNLTDIAGNPWWTLYAEKFMKWAEGPIGAYEYVGTTVAPGRVLQRYPARLEEVYLERLTPTLADDVLFNVTSGFNPALTFNLAAGVEWKFSIVGEGFYNPNADLPRSHSAGYIGDTKYEYGLNPKIDFFHFIEEQERVGIGSKTEKTDMVYVQGFKLDSSSEVPERLRDDIALTIILPAGIAMNQNVTIAWVTNSTGFVVLPDTEALRSYCDYPHILGGANYHFDATNFSGWLPSISHGQTNFIAWFQGVKVLDTTVPKGFPVGNLPPNLYWNTAADNTYGELWIYKLAIYEMGLVLEFSPGPNNETRPVPANVPFFFTDPTGDLVGPSTTISASSTAYSAKLTAPTSSDYAKVQTSLSRTFSSIADVKFWYMINSGAVKSTEDIGATWPNYVRLGQTVTQGYLSPYVVIHIFDGTNNHYIMSQPWAETSTGTWKEWKDEASNAYSKAIWHDEFFTDLLLGIVGIPTGWGRLSDWQTKYPGYSVVDIRIGLGNFAVTGLQCAYVDGITINGTVKIATEPGACLLGTEGAGLAEWTTEQNKEGFIQGYGIYDLVKAAPGGTYSNFMIVWKGAVIRASNVQSINLTGNIANKKLVFPVYDLNVTGWSQDPFVLVRVKVQLFSKTDFAQFGLPYYVIRSLLNSPLFLPAVLPDGWVYNETTGTTGFPIWSYATEPEWVEWISADKAVMPAMFEKLPAKSYDIWIATGNTTHDKWTPLQAGFRSVDANKTLYWTRDPWIGAPYNLTGHADLDINTYVYNPRLSIEDAGGNPLELAPTSQSAIFLVEPWYTAGAPNDFYDFKVAKAFNPYFIRINSTDATGHVTLYSVNASVTKPVDPNFINRTADDFPQESRYLVGKSTFHAVNPYRFMVYYKGVLVFNASVPLQNPYVSKNHPIVTSVYPYIFKVTNMPLPDETWRFGIQNLKVDVSWAGLNLTWWPSFSLVTETAVKEFSLLNASKLVKGFNMSVLKRLWGPTPVNPVTLIEIPYTPVPPYFCSNLFVQSGVSDANGEFKVLVPVWNYSYSNMTFTYLKAHNSTLYMMKGGSLNMSSGGPRKPWNVTGLPLDINLLTWWQACGVHGTENMSGYFGTPIYANWFTIPGTTNNIPATDTARLAATLQPAWKALNQSWNWPWVYSVNATGLVNRTSYYAQGTGPAKSLTTNSTLGIHGIGILSGGVFQGRQKVNVFESTVVAPPQPYVNFYAKLQVTTIANDIGVTVQDIFKDDLPNQYVDVITTWDTGRTYANATITGTVLFKDYTPVNKVPSFLVIRSTPTNILWGFYDFYVRTSNLTQIPGQNLVKDWQLDPQYLYAVLPGGSVDWKSDYIILRWPTKLQLTIYAGDGARYLHNAWAFIVDGVNNNNVTAALTDDAGYPSSIDITDPTLVTAWATDPLATGNPSGSRLNLGFNLGYYNETTGGLLYHNIGYVGTYNVYCSSGSGKWIVKVFWKAPDAGAVKTFGKVEGVSVWDTFRDQPQHRYIYLGVPMPASATGEDNAPAQVRTFSTKVYDLKLVVLDQSPSARAITSAPVTITAPDPSPDWVIAKTTSAAGEVTLNLVPAGKYQIVATSPVALYSKPASQITASVEARVIDGPTTILVPLPIFDATVTLVTPSGKPIVGADITVGGVALGKTDAAGNALATSIPSGSYTVTSSWFGQDISPTVPLTVTLSRTYLLTASKIALVQIQVVGAQNQGLPQAAVSIKTGTTTVFTGMTNNDGVVAIELPFGTYDVKASHKGVEATKTISVTGDTVEKITTGVFIELFGQGLTFAGFALWVIAVLVVVLILVIAGQEYNIYRRKRLPQLFGAGPTR